jgi:branched-chain amino acid aminotransferase
MVSVFDRSFTLGDGLYETLRILESHPVLWREHWRRFHRSAKELEIPLPLNSVETREAIRRLVERNQACDAVLRLHLSRGVGPRGFSPTAARNPTFVMSLHPFQRPTPGRPPRVRLAASSFRVALPDPSHRIKTASRMLHVLAKAAAEKAGFDDALLLNVRGRVLEATSSNFFWIEDSRLITPPLDGCLLPGTTRAVVIALAPGMGLTVQEVPASLARIRRCDGAFLTVSTSGIVEVISIDGHALHLHPLTRALHAELEQKWSRASRRRAP